MFFGLTSSWLVGVDRVKAGFKTLSSSSLKKPSMSSMSIALYSGTPSVVGLGGLGGLFSFDGAGFSLAVAGGLGVTRGANSFMASVSLSGGLRVRTRLELVFGGRAAPLPSGAVR